MVDSRTLATKRHDPPNNTGLFGGSAFKNDYFLGTADQATG
jgi:hypothetical protein